MPKNTYFIKENCKKVEEIRDKVTVCWAENIKELKNLLLEGKFS